MGSRVLFIIGGLFLFLLVLQAIIDSTGSSFNIFELLMIIIVLAALIGLAYYFPETRLPMAGIALVLILGSIALMLVEFVGQRIK